MSESVNSSLDTIYEYLKTYIRQKILSYEFYQLNLGALWAVPRGWQLNLIAPESKSWPIEGLVVNLFTFINNYYQKFKR